MTPFFESLKDLALDYPDAPVLVRELTDKMMQSDCLPSSFIIDKFQRLDRSFQQLFSQLLD
jgi:hypothetical protein